MFCVQQAWLPSLRPEWGQTGPTGNNCATALVTHRGVSVANDPIHQFQISKLIPLEVGGYDLSFTNASLFMVATVVVTSAFLYLTTSSRSLVPSRLQSVSEMSYEFVA